MHDKLIAISALALSVICGLNMAHAQDGTVTFTGNALSATCTVGVDSKDITVDFGQVSATETVMKSIRKPFSVSLEDCPDTVTHVDVLISGELSPVSSVGLADHVDGSSAISDVTDWYIINGVDGHSIAINASEGGDTGFDIHQGTNVLPLIAQFNQNPSDGYTAQAGTHTGEAVYTLSYQ